MAWPDTVRRDDLRVEFKRGSGKGGQNRNKRDTACRITHLPTGLVGQSEDQRSQAQNKKMAFRRLCAQLVPIMKREVVATRRGPAEIIRTYHEPDQRVTDKRLPGRQWTYDEIIHGTKLDQLVNALVQP